MVGATPKFQIILTSTKRYGIIKYKFVNPEQITERVGEMMEINENQRKIIEAKEQKIVVVAAAASGKTAVLVERLKYLLNNGVDPTKIVAITFTNAAAAEIMERLNTPKGLFVGTVHAYCNYLLLSKAVSTHDFLEAEQFDKLFSEIKKHRECVREVDYLLLDEAQDSTPQQFEFLLDVVNPKNWMLVGDVRQSIYGWSGANPQYLVDLMAQNDVSTYNLNQNYRNDKNILEYAKSIIRLAGIDYIDRSISMADELGKVVIADYEPVSLARYIKKTGKPGDWFVLTRTNEQVETFSRYLKLEGIPYDTFKRSQFDNEQLNKKLEENTVKVLTIHTSKGLEANNVAVIGPKFYNTEEKCISYVAATRARHLLLWMRMPNKPQRREKTVSWET